MTQITNASISPELSGHSAGSGRGKAETTRELVVERLDTISTRVTASLVANEEQVEQVVRVLAGWMADRAPVRVLGAGRARLAAAIPANRLAHGGARVYLQDAEIPMPHSLHGGGIIAASASGKTPSVLEALRAARRKNEDIITVGLARNDAEEFAAQCTHFIGMASAGEARLTALADLGELAIAELLDCLVVLAGRTLGYTDATWRLGHEDLGATGPYDHRTSRE